MSSYISHFTDTYVVLDIETTGLSPQKNRIIEFAAVKVINGEVTDTFSTLINPGCSIPYFITSLTGISNRDVTSAPTIEEILPQIRDFIGDYIVLGHNVTFDIGFLRENYMECMGVSFDNNYTDTMRLSRKYFPHMSHHRLGDLEREFGLRNERAHRALSDVYLTLDAYEYIKSYVRKGEKIC